MLPAGIAADFNDAKPHLRPLLRGRWHLEMSRLGSQLHGANFRGDRTALPFCHDAVVLLGYDLPDKTLQLEPDVLEAWGVSFPEALKIAIANLRSVSPPQFSELQGGVKIGSWSDGYDVSRILLPEVMGQCGLGDDLIIMVPSRRSVILAAPANDNRIQLAMLGYARQIFEEHGGLVSAAMFRYQARRVAVYTPASALLAVKLNDLQIITASALYKEQKDMLDALHTQQRQDIFVAHFQVGQKPSGWMSACSWTQGVTTYLPKTDLVAMVVLDPKGGNAHWTKVLDWATMSRIAGERLQPVATFPPRYKVADFPPQAALDSAPAFQA